MGASYSKKWQADQMQVHIKRERAKAREIRGSQWWRQQLGARTCYHCKGQFPLQELTMDHVTPLSRGGKSTKNNLVVSCRACNATRGHLTTGELALWQFLETQPADAPQIEPRMPGNLDDVQG